MSNWRTYKAPNLGLLFYKRLYKDVGNTLLIKDGDSLKFKVNEKKSEFNEYYEDLYSKRLESYLNPDNLIIGNSNFSIFTTYPGLLIGSGYTHSTKTTGDASIGFYFDHTTGLPVVPGSSVKGVLRSLFELDYDENKKQEFTGEKSVAAINFILTEIEEDKNISNEEKAELQDFKSKLSEEFLNKIKTDIFGNQEEEGKDVFYDAVINISESGKGKFMGSDFITPHSNPLSNPIPIQFLKVVSNIAFRFQFKFTDINLSAKAKEILFKRILLTLGVGAKTNVGYGQLSETKFTSSDLNISDTKLTKDEFIVEDIILEINKEYDSILKSEKNGLIQIQIGTKNYDYNIGSNESNRWKLYQFVGKTIRINVIGLFKDGKIQKMEILKTDDSYNKKNKNRY